MPTMDERVARLLRQYRIGERVRAVETIIYGTGEEVPEGTVGVVRHTNVHGCTPLVTVEWEGLPPIGHPVVTATHRITSPSHIGPVAATDNVRTEEAMEPENVD